ncbi:hypothetical protein [Streptomyces lunaelactis]|uniref:hypothetical protein n=1 Tax=Streptomyces lunaelactis TaxID=1535768 RepID=UPI001585B21C|nr:hypothetical protein [Streptomyces lunaelactis]NUK16951.1 hypothetical protein [Streptomyces lunaelactis]
MPASAEMRLAPPVYQVDGVDWDSAAGTQYADFRGRIWEMTGVANAEGMPIAAAVKGDKTASLRKLVRKIGVLHKVGEPAPTTYVYEGHTYRTDCTYIDAAGDPWTHDGTWDPEPPGVPDAPSPQYTRPGEPEYALDIPALVHYHGPIHEQTS